VVNAVENRVRTCRVPLGLASSPGSAAVWVACGLGEIAQIDVATNKVSRTVPIGGSPFMLDADGNTVWVSHRDHGTVTRVDVGPEPVIETIPIGAGPFAVRVAFGSVWVTDRPEGRLFQLRSTDSGADDALVRTPSPEDALPRENDRPFPDDGTTATAPEVLMMGDESAPLILEVFTDFACSFCARFHEQTFPRIREEYIETGKLQFRYRAFPLDAKGRWLGRKQKARAKEAFRAAEAARCAAEQGLERFWEFYDKLMRSHSSLATANYELWASQSGLDGELLSACLDSAGVMGTPIFFLNGKRITGAKPYKVFEQAFEEELSANGNEP
jgi:protein-disulfide isomerase